MGGLGWEAMDWDLEVTEKGLGVVGLGTGASVQEMEGRGRVGLGREGDWVTGEGARVWEGVRVRVGKETGEMGKEEMGLEEVVRVVRVGEVAGLCGKEKERD